MPPRDPAALCIELHLLIDACLRNRVTYLDITGEVSVFETCAARDAEARDAGVMLMPGFEVVPSDCLAAHLKQRLPTATELSSRSRVSPGRRTAPPPS